MIALLAYSAWCIGIIALDRITKYMALSMLQPKVLTPFVEFKLVFNRGISWGIWHSEQQSFFIALTVGISAIIVGLAYHTYTRYHAGRPIYAELAVLAGACSNVFDRFRYHGVIDFVHVHIGEWSWPIFNIADIVIVLGISLMILEQYREQ